jgi:hypothetical protein
MNAGRQLRRLESDQKISIGFYLPNVPSLKIARDSGNVGERSSRLTPLWTERHSGLWLEGRASQAQRDPATNRKASDSYKVSPSGIIAIRFKIITLSVIPGGLVQFSG